MKLISKVQIQILLINLIFLFFFVLNTAYTATNNCNSFTYESTHLENHTYPSVIEITTQNPKKWSTRLLKILLGQNRIDKNLKKYLKAKIKVTYPNKSVCEYFGKVRIHGSTKSHVNLTNFNTSLRVNIDDGHINNKRNFALLNKKSVPFDDEIFVSSLFDELGYLSPLTYTTSVKFNNNVIEKYLFYEMPSLEMVKDKKRNNGIFLSSNKNNFAKPKISENFKRSIILNRIKNSEGISENNEIVIFNALDKLNYIFLNSLGIGNGKDCCFTKIVDTKFKDLKKIYAQGIYLLNFSTLDNQKEIENLSIFNILMNAVNAHTGLSLEERFFFYDPMFDTFEPVYRDGVPQIVNQNKFDTDIISLFDYEKKFIDALIYKINSVDINNFNQNLNKRNLNIDINKTKKIINNILRNLEIIKTLKLFDTYKTNFAQNYFFNHAEQNINLNLAFGGQNDEFEICSIDLKICRKIVLNQFQKTELLNDKFLNLKKFDKPIIYVRLSKKNYIENLKPKKNGLKSFKKIEIDKNQILYFNALEKNIKIDKLAKTIILNQENLSDQFIFVVKNFNDWQIKFNGSKQEYSKEYPLYKRSQIMIGGCVGFRNSEIANISIEINFNTCSKGLEVLNSLGSFKKININKSKLDAFDSEFSDLIIEEINIDSALSGECIGVKRGKYLIKNANVSDCGDHSVSVGEHAELILEKITANNSRRIMSKDSSLITIFDYTNLNSEECLLILRKNKQFDGAYIKVKKNNLNCESPKIEKDEFSKISYF
jgi:hypothetical protein